MTSDKGVILTVGILAGADRTAVVMPLATDDGGLDPTTICEDAVEAFVSTCVPQLLACISIDAQVTSVSAEGMMDGTVPFRVDFAPGTAVGTRDNPLMPANVSSLGTFYGDPADIGPGLRMRASHIFIPGLSMADVTVDKIVSTLESAIEAFITTLLNGFTTNLGGGKWYRVLAKSASTSIVQGLKRLISAIARLYVATQRRRLLPHT